MKPPRTSHTRKIAGPAAGLTLIEMLIVAAIIAMLSALTLPALRGLVGVGGLRGGVNTVTVALDQARAAAIENGVDAYVGFPPAGFGDEQARLSNLIVFRARKDGEANDYTPLSRWMKLPTGIFFDLEGVAFDGADLPKPAGTLLPRLDGEDVNPRVIRYDRFGRIRTGGAGMEIKVGDGVVLGGQLTFKPDSMETLKAQRLTGRWLVLQP
jgi:prepilin-type N-terminal cleavage/methylation domain-containing protein